MQQSHHPRGVVSIYQVASVGIFVGEWVLGEEELFEQVKSSYHKLAVNEAFALRVLVSIKKNCFFLK